MKRVTITYVMENREERAETCVTLPMEDGIAEELLRNERWSIQLQQGRMVRSVLENMARLQGYEYEGVLEAEE